MNGTPVACQNCEVPEPQREGWQPEGLTEGSGISLAGEDKQIFAIGG